MKIRGGGGVRMGRDVRIGRSNEERNADVSDIILHRMRRVMLCI